MAKRRKVSNPLALAVLTYLLVRPMHPYELGRMLTEHGKDRNIKYNQGSLYMVMEQLRKSGFVSEQETIRDTQRPERTIYGITESGRTELFDWMREIVVEPRKEYPHFGVALSLMIILTPVELTELLGKRLEALIKQTEESQDLIRKSTDNGVQWVFLAEEEYGLALMKAEISFITKLIESLQDPSYDRARQEIWENQSREEG
ncbi:PadR family transcriptional regulator [Cohnella sp. REN36]|uniref:PadR family transcriptional regulator n=1 Tax=Cohnella sp. REN36 TaxID=2887347 RepID=UPI001D1504CF|nr:PadR family transcriptional regulator [Cohnella sp. REN36]MCC3371916.1 PadR family transcriptional regulator [Cohnella sp. REN36]